MIRESQDSFREEGKSMEKGRDSDFGASALVTRQREVRPV